MHTPWSVQPGCYNLYLLPVAIFCLAVIISVPRGKRSLTYRRVVPAEKENGETFPDREGLTRSRAAVLLC